MLPDKPCPSAEALRRSLDPDDPMPESERRVVEAHVERCERGCKAAIEALLRGGTIAPASGATIDAAGPPAWLKEPQPSSPDPTIDENARRRFEAAWRDGPPPPIEEFLPPAGRADHLATLEELVAIDMEFRWKAGATPLEDYLARFPALDRPDIVSRLLRHEMTLRRKGGQHSPMAECRARFPQADLTGPEEDVMPARHGPTTPLRPPALPGYEILGELGRGGMGVVYKARHLGLNRVVAVKMILAGVDAGPEERARFRTEAEAVAALQHPNVVQIHEIGERDGLPYFTLEFVDGGNLARKLAAGPRPPAAAAELIQTLARAVHYAHGRGIVHRDLKPANVLLTSDGRPKLGDFGLAKRLEGPAGHTRSGAVVGTPSYMAPEQAAGRSKDVGPATDVYALGAMLYELLTGRPPFTAASALETLQQVLAEDPVPPRRLQPRTPRDLETICLKCLEKDPRRRYASAEALADDLRRYLSDQTILARPAGRVERLGRWAHRNRRLAAAGGAAIMGLLAATAASVALAVSQYADAEQLRTEKGRTEAARKQSDRLAAGLALDEGVGLCERDDVRVGLLWLARGVELAPDDDRLQWTLRTALAGWRQDLNAPRPALRCDGPVWAAVFSPDGRRILTFGYRGAQLWDAATGEPVGPLLPEGSPQGGYAAFSADGATFLVAGTRGAFLWETGADGPAGSRRRFAWPDATDGRLSRDGRFVLTIRPKEMQLWDAVTGKPVWPAAKVFTEAVGDAAFSPDGKTILNAQVAGTARLWDAATGDPIGEPLHHSDVISAVAFSPDGRTALTVGADRAAKLWNAADGKPAGETRWHSDKIAKGLFSPDGKRILTGTWVPRTTAQVWDLDGDPRHSRWSVAQDVVTSLAFRPDGALWASGAADGAARLTQTLTSEPWGQPLRHLDCVESIAFSPDGMTVLTGGRDGTARVWDVAPGRSLAPTVWLPTPPRCFAVSPDGRTLVTGSAAGAQLWDAATGRPVGPVLEPGRLIKITAFSSDGAAVATAGDGPTARLWDAATGAPLCDPLENAGRILAVAFRPDGRVLLTASLGADGASPIRFWDVPTGKLRGTIRIATAAFTPMASAAFSPDGARILTGDAGRAARLWDASTGEAIGPAMPQAATVWDVAFDPAGATLLTAGESQARLWQAATGEPISRPTFPHPQRVASIAFSPDGRMVLTGGDDGTARLWDAAAGKLLAPPMPHHAAVVRAAFARNGEVVWTAGLDQMARCWRVPSPVQGDAKRISLWVQVLTCMEMDGDGNTRELDAEQWNTRRRQLEEAGGAPMP